MRKKLVQPEKSHDQCSENDQDVSPLTPSLSQGSTLWPMGSSSCYDLHLVNDKLDALQIQPANEPRVPHTPLTSDALISLSTPISTRRKRILSSVGTSRHQVSQVIMDMDCTRTHSQVEFGEWKSGKWGEADLDGVDLDPDDFDLEVLGDVVVPTWQELLNQVRQALSEGCGHLSRVHLFLCSDLFKHHVGRCLGSLWYQWLEFSDSVLETIDKEGFAIFSVTAICLFVIETIISLLTFSMTISGIRFVLHLMDRPTLIKINYFHASEWPTTRFRAHRP